MPKGVVAVFLKVTTCSTVRYISVVYDLLKTWCSLESWSKLIEQELEPGGA